MLRLRHRLEGDPHRPGCSGPDLSAADGGAFLPGSLIDRPPTGRGILGGSRFAVKDLIDVAGAVTGGGTPDWAATHAPADADAPCVAALSRAGAHLHGKTVTDELAFSLEGVNHHYGTPCNPRAPGCLPGGSSSGSASAVAGGAVDFALGTDTGGSVRVPAAFCGLFGLRPTHGAISLAGVMPFAPSYDTVGLLARDATVLGRAAAVLLLAGASNPAPRFMLAEDAFALAEPAVARALFDGLPATWRAAPRVSIFDGAPGDWREAYRMLQGWEIRQTLEPWLSQARPRLGPSIAARFADAATITDAEAEGWRPWRRSVQQRMVDLLGHDGVLLLPSASTVALPLSAAPASVASFYMNTLTLTSVAGHAGLPAISLPVGQVDGAPAGLSLLGRPGSDRELVALAGAMSGRAEGNGRAPTALLMPGAVVSQS